MLAVSPLTHCTSSERAGDAGATNLLVADDFSADFDFDFSELFAGFDDGEVLPGLEVDFPSPETLGVGVEVLEVDGSVKQDGERVVAEEVGETVSAVCDDVLSCGTIDEASKKMSSEVDSSAPEGQWGRKLSTRQVKGSIGKKKTKVDWTPELHRQFVQAVEQLGVEKAVPSRILELMKIDCLTRHNVASHLQKYRSHRKHMLVRETESKSWSQRNKVYPMATTITTDNIPGVKKDMNSWPAPTIGFPSSAPPPHPLHMHSIRPLHVWGHPSMDSSLVNMWHHPKHLFTMRPAPPPPWVAHHPSFQHPPLFPQVSPWNPQFSTGPLSPGALYFPRQLPNMRFPTPPVPGIPPHPMYRPEDFLPATTPPTPARTNQTGWQLQYDAHPSNESIDEAIGEVLAQPWLPVPLGLKPPSLESVMEELQKEGISTVPPCN